MNNIIIKHGSGYAKFNFLKWDAQYFGKICYSLDCDSFRLGGEEFAKLISERLGKSFTVAKTNDPRLLEFLFKMNFKYINTEVVMELDGDRRKDYKIFSPSFGTPKLNMVSIEKMDYVPIYMYLLGKEFRYDRFHVDSHITKHEADGVWMETIKNFKLTNEKHLFIAKINHKIAGGIFIKEENENRLTLVVTKKEYRNSGIGSLLLRIALDWCERNGKKTVVGTQVNNIEAMNFYIKNGFTKIKETSVILHRWITA